MNPQGARGPAHQHVSANRLFAARPSARQKRVRKGARPRAHSDKNRDLGWMNGWLENRQ